jgi:hypothetical protein
MSILRDTLLMSLYNQNRVLEFGPFLSQLVTRHPDWLEELQSSGRLENVCPPSADHLAAVIDKIGLDPALQQQGSE